MRRLLLSTPLAALALVLASTSAGGEDAAETRGAEQLMPFKQALQQALREGLARGPVEAIDACRVRAPEIADSISKGGVRVGRSSHRLRNPDNLAPDWVAPILAEWVDGAEPTPRSVALSGGQSGYVEPILTQPLCLTCHGGALAPDVAKQIRALYPDDRAVGFREGELRGVFWIELPAPD